MVKTQMNHCEARKIGVIFILSLWLYFEFQVQHRL
jgi:hypothetical protein